jgi:anhydro-N-acetylmuramic acid kinase
MLAIGLVSPTSATGIYAALVESDGENVARVLAHEILPYNSALQDLIAQACAIGTQMDLPGPDPVIDEADHVITMLHTEAVRQILNQMNMDREVIEIIGFSGLIIPHQRHWTIGNGATLADSTGIQTVSPLHIDPEGEAERQAQAVARTAVRYLKFLPVAGAGPDDGDNLPPEPVLHRPKSI